ncbi:MAG: ATP-dependent DNA ligase [Pseudomonadota bacterium]|nr:ATP-dependent DNA ligase [Pseudomonadota bacterium]
MRRFADLYEAIDQTTSTNRKVEAMVAWFRAADPADAAWALWFLTGNRIKRLVPTRELRSAAVAASGYPEWMLAESYAAVGDLAETLALLVDSLADDEGDLPLHVWMARVVTLPTLDAAEREAALRRWWAALPRRERYVFNKLLTGAFRVGVSHTLVVRALAEVAGVPAATLAHRLMGSWAPTAEAWRGLLGEEQGTEDLSRPYPFFLASPLEGEPASLGDPAAWLAEWKWDGIRAQVIRREGTIAVWSRGEELVTDRFPEVATAAARLPSGTVLDGELMAWRGEAPLPFADLQTRIGRKKLDKRVLDAVPVALVAFDVLEADGVDLRERPLSERRARLAEIVAPLAPAVRLSEEVRAPDWEGLATHRQGARELGVEGLLLKRRDSAYGVGRPRGPWWKWKVAPLTMDGVLVYAQAGHGKRAGLYTDYTFAVWQDGALLPVAKAYSGLTNVEIEELDRWIRRHTVEKFGPVRSLEPVHVFEIAFEGIAPSPRHKSGVAVRFPRILRWRRDKAAADADTLASLQALLRVQA